MFASYAALCVIWFALLHWVIKTPRNWHFVLCWTLFVPVTLAFLIFAGIAELLKWLGEER